MCQNAGRIILSVGNCVTQGLLFCPFEPPRQSVGAGKLSWAARSPGIVSSGNQGREKDFSDFFQSQGLLRLE